MSDRFDTRYVIGGAITEDAQRMLGEMLAEIEMVDGSVASMEDVKDAIEAKESLDLYCRGLGWGEDSELEEFLKINDLTFFKHVEPKYEFLGDAVYWEPGTEIRAEDCDDDGDILVKLPELEQAVKEGKTLQDVIAKHQMKGAKDVPALTLKVEVEEPVSRVTKRARKR